MFKSNLTNYNDLSLLMKYGFTTIHQRQNKSKNMACWKKFPSNMQAITEKNAYEVN